ncbi:MAG TPA: hypothetical protein VNZ01_11800 [Solirubrobacteraceae bacterium]|nr:hypothetical protein [Solirubrobacteraceae bacterium]
MSSRVIGQHDETRPSAMAANEPRVPPDRAADVVAEQQDPGHDQRLALSPRFVPRAPS